MSSLTRWVGNFQVTAWSVSGLETCVVVRRGSFQICFDIGIALPESVSCTHVFVSHGHIDHIGALATHARKRELQRLPPATYFLPREIVEPARQVMALFAAMHGGEGAESLKSPKLVPLDPGQQIELPCGRFLRTFRTVHRVTSLGFLVFRHGRKRPSEEGAASGEGATLASDSVSVPELAYLGDTAFSVFLKSELPELLQVELLITEMTYLDREEDRGPQNQGLLSRARQYGHSHLVELQQHAHLFQEVGHILLIHISDRYTPSMVRDRLRQYLPPQLCVKTIPATWMKEVYRPPK